MRIWPPGIGALAGALGGVLVGAGDGLRAARLLGLDASSAAAAVVLASTLDLAAGLGAGAILEAVVRLAVWGRARQAPAWARALAWLGAGAGAAAAVAGVVALTALRNNRFLAAGLSALAALGATLAGVVLAPALARLLSGRRAAAVPWRPPSPPSLLAVPLAAALLSGAVFLVVWRVRAPLGQGVLRGRMLAAALLAAPLPAAVAWAGGLRRPSLSWRAAGAAATALFAVPAGVIGARSWEANLRFAPWTDIAVAAIIAAVAVAALLARRFVTMPRLPLPAWASAVAAPVVLAAALGIAVRAESIESARKAAARAGLAGPLLAAARVVLDFDHDGYPRWLSGGDCDDRNPDVHPGARDWPGDGVDQDCDGRDMTLVPLASPPLVEVPAAVPADLDIVFITIDTLRADHLGCYGYGRPTSPEIDALAREATVFDNGWAHAPSTRFSMPAIATGRWPSAIEWDESIWWPRIDAHVPTLAEALKGAGLFTGALYNFNYFARADHRGFERGMDVYEDRRMALHVAVNGPMESRGSSSREMADDAIDFLRAHEAQRFFLWVHFYDPHLSYERHPDGPDFGGGRMDLYDGEIRFTDTHVGRVLAELRRLGLWGKTAVFVTGDHGEGFGEHGITEHGYHLYGAQTRVPMIVRVPGLAPGRVATPVGHVDIAPTMVNLARGAPAPSFLGRSMVDLLAGRARASSEPVFQEVNFEGPTRRSGLVSATRHLLWNQVPDGTRECYDTVADRGETRDLWGRRPADAECAALAARLEALVATLSLPPGFGEKLAFGVLAPGAAAPPPAHPIEATLGDAVRVLGWDGPTEVAAGGDVEITVHMRVLRPIRDGWRPFFHLEGPSGHRTLDHVPVEGSYPVERWQAGQLIRDRFRVSFAGAARGPHTVFAGMFRKNERLPVTPAALSDGENRLRVATVVVR